jgi:hypothetical protein
MNVIVTLLVQNVKDSIHQDSIHQVGSLSRDHRQVLGLPLGYPSHQAGHPGEPGAEQNIPAPAAFLSRLSDRDFGRINNRSRFRWLKELRSNNSQQSDNQ